MVLFSGKEWKVLENLRVMYFLTVQLGESSGTHIFNISTQISFPLKHSVKA